MQLRRLWLTDFRSYRDADLSFDPGLTAILGPNGQGKTNLLEAIAYLATLGSFRGAPTDALVRVGAERAVVRAEAER
ncbi:MAG: AAA family ATPase, partial [Acidimicrobiales bacterium]|nr:AAA family ATPase [Acidimicrobiales bacterium]